LALENAFGQLLISSFIEIAGFATPVNLSGRFPYQQMLEQVECAGGQGCARFLNNRTLQRAPAAFDTGVGIGSGNHREVSEP
jgi:hypothetical protein